METLSILAVRTTPAQGEKRTLQLANKQKKAAQGSLCGLLETRLFSRIDG